MELLPEEIRKTLPPALLTGACARPDCCYQDSCYLVAYPIGRNLPRRRSSPTPCNADTQYSLQKEGASPAQRVQAGGLLWPSGGTPS